MVKNNVRANTYRALVILRNDAKPVLQSLKQFSTEGMACFMIQFSQCYVDRVVRRLAFPSAPTITSDIPHLDFISFLSSSPKEN